MVTGAAWADVTGDAAKELVIAGEWMTPRIFSFKKDHFEEVKTNLNNLYGWWQTVAVADINNDGKADLILGNIGENFKLQPGENTPVKLWLNDFDNNGTVDKILSYTIDSKDHPVVMKRDMEEQMPIIKKQNLKYVDYAKKSIQELFAPELIKKSTVKQFNYCSSIIAVNKGNGNFDIQKLPVMSQMSCINSVLCTDVNKDRFTDIIFGGNQFGFLPQYERLDGCSADVLINDGKGNFKLQDPFDTGLHLRGELRDIQKIKMRDRSTFLFLQNNSVPVLYNLNNFSSQK
jgi:hypothetical protein